MRGDDARGCAMPMSDHARPKAVSPTRRVEPRRPPRRSKRQLYGRKLDSGGDRGAPVASVTCSVLWREHTMTANGDIPNGAVASIARRPPVRVKLRRINADLAKAYPPDGETRAWWERLKRALGTSSSAFVNSSLVQLQAAARLPFGGISETAVNAALAMIEAAAPKDEIEGALAVQMACTHTAAMAVLARLGGGHGSELQWRRSDRPRLGY